MNIFEVILMFVLGHLVILLIKPKIKPLLDAIWEVVAAAWWRIKYPVQKMLQPEKSIRMKDGSFRVPVFQKIRTGPFSSRVVIIGWRTEGKDYEK